MKIFSHNKVLYSLRIVANEKSPLYIFKAALLEIKTLLQEFSLLISEQRVFYSQKCLPHFIRCSTPMNYLQFCSRTKIMPFCLFGKPPPPPPLIIIVPSFGGFFHMIPTFDYRYSYVLILKVRRICVLFLFNSVTCQIVCLSQGGYRIGEVIFVIFLPGNGVPLTLSLSLVCSQQHTNQIQTLCHCVRTILYYCS